MPDSTNRPLRVFLCHSSKDKVAVRELYKKLHQNDWLDPWLDEEKLLPGQDWHMEIEKAVEVTDVVVVLLSNQSVSQEGYVQRELKLALDVADEKPEGAIFIVPLRLDDCPAPRRLRGWQYVDYFPIDRKDWAIERVIASLKLRADSLGLKFDKNISPAQIRSSISPQPMLTENDGNVQHTINGNFISVKGNVIGSNLIVRNNNQSSIVEEKKLVAEKSQSVKPAETISNKLTLSNGMEFMRVPAGKFLMGSSAENKDAFVDEHPQHTVDIPYDYWMARFPVTNEQYNQYVTAKKIKHPVSEWMQKKDHPVTDVSWNDAMEYCQWLNDLLKRELPPSCLLRLPTESEWEKTARGIDGREYPWGNVFDKNKCNSKEGEKVTTTSVDLYSPQGDSPFGCADMAGNVWEWTHSLDKKYPYNVSDGRERNEGNYAFDIRILRGGSCYLEARRVRCAYRSGGDPDGRVFGFRIVVSRGFS